MRINNGHDFERTKRGDGELSLGDFFQEHGEIICLRTQSERVRKRERVRERARESVWERDNMTEEEDIVDFFLREKPDQDKKNSETKRGKAEWRNTYQIYFDNSSKIPCISTCPNSVSH